MNKLLGTIFRHLLPYRANKENHKVLMSSEEESKPIYLFFHIYAANRWKGIVEEIVFHLSKSGLMSQIHKAYLSLISTNAEEDIEFVKNQFIEISKYRGGVIISISDNCSDFEFPALETLYQTALEDNDFNALYIHSKGSGNSPNSVKNYYPKISSYKELVKVSDEVRHFMLYWNVDHYKLALNKLQEGYDCYGAHYCEQPPFRFYGGNYWWAKSSYIRSLKPFSIEDKLWRYSAETWVLSNDKAKIYYTCRVHAPLAATGIPQGVYCGSMIKKLYSRIIFSFHLIHKKFTIKYMSYK